uniref:uncharacterized protein LOC120336575 isoform X1 n=1 Tax=Styela clava TaxID=7725 RepID=UPI0019394DD7|nr:uncharacterized protein LOC120336575 isoform X1 [Styela clava]
MVFFIAVKLILVMMIAYGESLESKTCGTPMKKDIEWNKLPSGPYYDVLDIPRSEKPIGCWNIQNITEEKDRVVLDMATFSSRDVSILPVRLEYFRTTKTGVYKMNRFGEMEYRTAFYHFNDDNGVGIRETADEESADLAQHEFIFLTDYQTYFMLVGCQEEGWIAYVKATTPHITVSQLNHISNALVENGLKAPVMVLKNECLNAGDSGNVVVIG